MVKSTYMKIRPNYSRKESLIVAAYEGKIERVAELGHQECFVKQFPDMDLHRTCVCIFENPSSDKLLMYNHKG